MLHVPLLVFIKLKFSLYLLILFVLKEIGEREGKFYAINVPLKNGIDDTSFTRLFKTVSSVRK